MDRRDKNKRALISTALTAEAFFNQPDISVGGVRYGPYACSHTRAQGSNTASSSLIRGLLLMMVEGVGLRSS